MKGEMELDDVGGSLPKDSDPLIEKRSGAASSCTAEMRSPTSSGEIKDEDIEAAPTACCRICLEYECDPGDELISPCMCKGTQQFVHRSCLDHWRSEGFAFSHCTTCKAQFHLRVEFLEDYSWRKIKFRIFVARDVLLVFLAVQTVIAAMGGIAYIMDRNGNFRNSFSDSWDRILSKHPIPFYYCIGVLIFFVLTGFFGLILHCSSFSNNDPCMAGCRNCCYGWGILDCFPASMEACFALVVVFVIVFAILGVAYGFLAATMGIQRIWQRHYHILTKRELTKAESLPFFSYIPFVFHGCIVGDREYVVEDLRGCYTPPKLDPEHEERLRMWPFKLWVTRVGSDGSCHNVVVGRCGPGDLRRWGGQGSLAAGKGSKHLSAVKDEGGGLDYAMQARDVKNLKKLFVHNLLLLDLLILRAFLLVLQALKE
ncbi:hypothetical protein Taro_053367, partial [Colocasia esculenta]|nr:hypothetical protein [Colocasia esculenta]